MLTLGRTRGKIILSITRIGCGRVRKNDEKRRGRTRLAERASEGGRGGDKIRGWRLLSYLNAKEQKGGDYTAKRDSEGANCNRGRWDNPEV